MSANNVVEHCRKKQNKEKVMDANNCTNTPLLFDVTKEELRQANVDDVEIVADVAVGNLVETLHKYGYMIDEIKDIGLMYETVKASMLRTIGIDHFLQKVSDKYIQIKD